MHRQSLGGGDDKTARIDDDPRALTVIFQLFDACVEDVECEVGADRAPECTVLPIVGNSDGDNHLLRHRVLIDLSEDRLARCLGVFIPVAPARVDRGDVTVVPADEAAVLGTVGEVEDILVIRGETHHLAIHHDGAAVICLKQIRSAHRLLLFLNEPCVEILCLDVEECVDLPGGALCEGVLRLVVADSADRHDKQRHECPHQEQFLFNTQNPLSLS